MLYFLLFILFYQNLYKIKNIIDIMIYTLFISKRWFFIKYKQNNHYFKLKFLLQYQIEFKNEMKDMLLDQNFMIKTNLTLIYNYS